MYSDFADVFKDNRTSVVIPPRKYFKVIRNFPKSRYIDASLCKRVVKFSLDGDELDVDKLSAVLSYHVDIMNLGYITSFTITFK